MRKMNESDNQTQSLLDALITDLIAEWPLEAIVNAANLDKNEFRILELTLRKIVKYRLDQLYETGNEELKRECIVLSGAKTH